MSSDYHTSYVILHNFHGCSLVRNFYHITIGHSFTSEHAGQQALNTQVQNGSQNRLELKVAQVGAEVIENTNALLTENI
jgi:hypothetical protein